MNGHLYLWLIPLLPFAGFLINGILGARLPKWVVTAVGLIAPAWSFGLVAIAAVTVITQGPRVLPMAEDLGSWISAGSLHVDFRFVLDQLSLTMLLIVTGVGFLIHVYSVGYMHSEKGYWRYFAYLNLFLFFMLTLVLGLSLLVCFVGWEGVGLASYLLIGFWFEDPEKARAGKKAFITNRVGDAGFLLGMFLLYHALGTLEFDGVQAAFAGGAPAALSADLVGILLFIGATGKSAQIPLHVWLPDAMAGPTPVSALIHAATMVTAGVYLVARLNGIYAHAPVASEVIAVIGVATALFAATIAVTQTDIKKVLAWSTISQLGYMFLALGVGAYGAAVFHLYTHAFFKACLFLGAGSVIHALSGEQDIRRMGGLARRIPVTFATFAVATAAIAGIPPLAGFFSKDEILWFAFASDRGGSPLLWAVGAGTALLTAFYMFRLLWLTFLSPSRMDEKTAHHVHESPPAMTGVLVVLAALSAVGGFVALPHFLSPLLPAARAVTGLEEYETPLLVTSVAIALAGLVAAAWLYADGPARADRLAARVPRLHRLLSSRYYIDELYAVVITRPIQWLSDAVFLRVGDRILIDGTLHGLAALARGAAGQLSRVQAGGVQRYVLLAALGILIGVVWVWRHV